MPTRHRREEHQRTPQIVSGPVAAASMWTALNCVYVAVGIPLTHHYLLRGEALRWFGDIALPLASVSLIALIGRGLVATSISAPAEVVALLGLGPRHGPGGNARDHHGGTLVNREAPALGTAPGGFRGHHFPCG